MSLKKEKSLLLVKALNDAKIDLISNNLIMDKKDKHKYPIKASFLTPNHYEWLYLSDASIIQEGPGLRKYQYTESGVQFLTVTNILEGSIDFKKSQKYIDFVEYEKKYKHFTINSGDIVTACSGASWGKSAIFESDNLMMLNTSTLRLRFFKDLAENKYLYYFTKSNYFKANLASHSTGQQANYGYSHYSKIPIPIPPLEEQKEIVSILDDAFASIDKAKANIERNIENAKELFQSKLNEIFSQNKYPRQKLSELTNLITKGSSPKWQGIKYVEEPGLLFITSENVGTGKLLMNKKKYLEISFNEKQKRSILNYGDVLSNIVGASIGRTAVFNLEDTANINQAVCLIRCNLSLLNNFYLMHLLNSPILKEIMSENEVDMARANLSLTFFKNLLISIPDIEKQKEIVKSIDQIDNSIQSLLSKYQKELENLEELKKSILQKAFSGELTNKSVAA